MGVFPGRWVADGEWGRVGGGRRRKKGCRKE